MKVGIKTIFLSILFFFFICSNSYSASIHYIDTGKRMEKIRITFSRDKGNSWKTVQIRNGQTFSIPRDTTHLRINNVPYPPNRNYKVKEGNVY